MSATDKLATSRFVSGTRLLAEACYRRLTTPRGSLAGGDEESTYGLDLAGYVGALTDSVAAGSLPGVVEAELLKDDRVAAAVVAVSSSTDSDGATYLVSIDITPADETEDFSLTLAVSEVSVSLIGGLP